MKTLGNLSSHIVPIALVCERVHSQTHFAPERAHKHTHAHTQQALQHTLRNGICPSPGCALYILYSYWSTQRVEAPLWCAVGVVEINI